MDDRLNRIEEKIDKINDRLSETNAILAAQHESLAIHIKRTDLLEAKIEPIEKHTSMMQGAMKLISALGVLAALISTILKLMKVI